LAFEQKIQAIKKAMPFHSIPFLSLVDQYYIMQNLVGGFLNTKDSITPTLDRASLQRWIEYLSNARESASPF
jgi:hypothetical protein